MKIENPVFLYVEDDALSRQVMKIFLTRGLGYENIFIFENSSDFEERLKALPTKPNIVFLDINVHPFDGFEMLTVLRNHPDYESAMVIALTASVMNEEVSRLKQSGFNGAIAKPINQTLFPSLLERLLNGESVWYIK